MTVQSHPSQPKLLHVCTVPITLKLFMRGQIQYVKSAGFEVAAAASPGPDLLDVAKRDGIKVYSVNFARKPSPIRDAVSMIRLFGLFLQVRPTIVHASTSKAGPFAMMAAYLARVPVRVYTLRGVMTDRRKGLIKNILKALEWAACRCAHRVIAVSRSVAEVVVSAGLCPPGRIRVLGNGSSNGVDAEDRFNPDLVDECRIKELRTQLNLREGAKVIGFVGRLVAGKGVADLASAWERVRQERDDTVLLLIGNSEEQAPVPPEIMNRFKADTRVIMTDFVTNELLPLYYSLIDVVAFPTESEGFPNVPLEAAAMEIPVVATRVTGCVDAIVDGVTGTLVPPGDPTRLAEALLRYLDDSRSGSICGRAARERVLRDFRPELVWKSLHEEYLNLLQQQGIVPPQEH